MKMTWDDMKNSEIWLRILIELYLNYKRFIKLSNQVDMKRRSMQVKWVHFESNLKKKLYSSVLEFLKYERRSIMLKQNMTEFELIMGNCSISFNGRSMLSKIKEKVWKTSMLKWNEMWWTLENCLKMKQKSWNSTLWWSMVFENGLRKIESRLKKQKMRTNSWQTLFKSFKLLCLGLLS